MTDGREIVRSLEQELDATQQRCVALERAISGMREIYGITGDVDDDVEDTPAPRRGRKSGSKKAGKRTKQASKQGKTRASERRHL